MNAKIGGSRYVLAVKNLDKSIEFYTNFLGFRLLWKDDGWGFVVRDSCQIMLGECPDDVAAFETGCHSYFAYLEVENIEILYDEFVSKRQLNLAKWKINLGKCESLALKQLMDTELCLEWRFKKS